ncbi:MAG TPA: LuxR C-terminal-related transcriptional regulator [Methylomirabilota bacterium]|nr:LuxR C-terminal-related transcriptional regulator [Methylomirabilota bacterium]
MDKPHKTNSAAARAARPLTARQREVLDLVAAGNSNKEIAHRVGISEAAVKKHLEALRRRYGANNRVQLVRAAVEHGHLKLSRKK